MPRSGYFVDANLLVLLVVGRTDPNLITKHRRLRGYTSEDYRMLVEELGKVERIFVTPNTLTETSNLLAQHGDPERSQFFDMFQFIIQESQEIIVESVTASSRSEFNLLGLTDAALLEAITEETPLLTVDLDLYIAALQRGQDVAINFNYRRNV